MTLFEWRPMNKVRTHWSIHLICPPFPFGYGYTVASLIIWQHILGATHGHRHGIENSHEKGLIARQRHHGTRQYKLSIIYISWIKMVYRNNNSDGNSGSQRWIYTSTNCTSQRCHYYFPIIALFLASGLNDAMLLFFFFGCFSLVLSWSSFEATAFRIRNPICMPVAKKFGWKKRKELPNKHIGSKQKIANAARGIFWCLTKNIYIYIGRIICMRKGQKQMLIT